MAIIRFEEQTGYKDWLKNTNGSWQYDASIQATTDENSFIYLTNTGEDDAVFQIALSKLVDIQLIRKNSILVTPSIFDKAKGIKVKLRDQSQNILATSRPSLNSKAWTYLLANAEDIALDITELWITFVLPAGASTIISGIQGQILTQDQIVVDSIKVEATDGDAAIDLTQAKLNASKYFVKFAPESWWRADGVLKAKQLLTVDPLDITVNVAEAMDKIFYVDAVNGNDNNDGSSSAPFKTLKKAIDSIPAGGYGNLFLADGDYTADDIVYVCNKTVFISCSNVSNLARIKFHTYNSANYERPYCIELRNSQLLIYGHNKCSIETPQLSLGLPIYNEAPFMVRGAGLFGFVSCDITINDFYLVRGYYSAGNVNAISALFSDNTITKNTDKNILICDKLLFHSSYNDTLQDSSGNPLSWLDVIDGIVKDANDVPRNIVSNIIL